jgi:hypothetical protein
MGLDELLPDDEEVSSSSSSSSTSGSDEDDEVEYVETFSSDKGTKKYTEEQWEKMEEVIRQETEYTVGGAKNLPAEKRHDVMHEVALIATSDYEAEEAENTTDKRCVVCGNACSRDYVKLEGHRVHVMHNVAQVGEAIDEKEIK